MAIVTARCEEDLATGGFLMWPNGAVKALPLPPPRTRVMLDLHKRGKALAEFGEVSKKYKE